MSARMVCLLGGPEDGLVEDLEEAVLGCLASHIFPDRRQHQNVGKRGRKIMQSGARRSRAASQASRTRNSPGPGERPATTMPPQGPRR